MVPPPPPPHAAPTPQPPPATTSLPQEATSADNPVSEIPVPPATARQDPAATDPIPSLSDAVPTDPEEVVATAEAPGVAVAGIDEGVQGNGITSGPEAGPSALKTSNGGEASAASRVIGEGSAEGDEAHIGGFGKEGEGERAAPPASVGAVAFGLGDSKDGGAGELLLEGKGGEGRANGSHVEEAHAAVPEEGPPEGVTLKPQDSNGTAVQVGMPGVDCLKDIVKKVRTPAYGCCKCSFMLKSANECLR